MITVVNANRIGAIQGASPLVSGANSFAGSVAVLLAQFGFLLLLCASACAAQQVHLAVSVVDEKGAAVSSARVNIHQSKLFLFRRGVVVPPDYQQETNAQGLARFVINIEPGAKLELAVEVAREDMASETHDLDLGTNYPTRLPLEMFILKKKSEGGAGPVIDVVIAVQNPEREPVVGASVLIWDTSLGSASGRFTGTTGADGRATIHVLYASADPREQLPVQVTKSGYQDGKSTVDLTKKQIGQTVPGGTVTIEKAAKDATQVTVTVLDEKRKSPIGDAIVILDGASYYKERTNAAGLATYLIPQTGTFTVRISQDNYRSTEGELRLVSGDKEKPVTFLLEPKATKDEGEDLIEVTVLAKDPTDEKASPVPLAGALVKAGSLSAATDANGVATLKGAFEERQEVSVDASGYKSQRRTIGVSKMLHYSRGKGTAKFTLEPELSEKSALRLIVEIHDASGAKVPNAKVDFVAANGVQLASFSSGSDGQVDFRSSENARAPIAELRKGITLNVQAAGYKEILNRSVPANVLQPSLEAHTYTIELTKDWSELANLIAELEGRVAAWNADRYANPSKESEAAMIDKALVARKSAEALLQEIESAKTSFNLAGGPGLPAAWCEKAKALQEEIRRCEKEASQKSAELKRLLDEATSAASSCAEQGDVERVRANYRASIKLLGEIGVTNKKAVRTRDDLLSMAQESLARNTTLAELQAKLAAIGAHLKTAEENAKSANAQFKRNADLRKTILSRQAGLKAEVAAFSAKYGNEKDLPSALRNRIDALARRLDTNDTVSVFDQAKKVPESVASAPEAIGKMEADASKMLAIYRNAACEIDDLHEVVDGINTTLTNAGFEVGLAANLPTDADACAAKLAAAEEVTVPDFSGLNQPGAMKALATQAGMSVTFAATKGTGDRLFAGQDPSANSKVKRSRPITIFLNQKVAQSTPTPTPTPIAQTTPSPTPKTTADEVVVPSLAGFPNVAAMKAALSSVGLTGVFNAKGKPPTKELEFKFAQQDPAAGEKVKRGSPVNVFIYQKFEAATASPTPTPALATTPGQMPNLIGLTLEQADARLTSNMRIGGDEVGDQPPTPEKALTIFAQTPPAGANLAADKPVIVTVKRYGSAKAEDATVSSSSEPSSSGATGFEGKWAGHLAFQGLKGQFVTVNIRREGSAYIVSSSKGQPVPMTLEGGRLTYELKLDFSAVGGMLGGQGKDLDPSTIRITATLVSNDELSVYVKVTSKKEKKEGSAGVLKRVP